MKTMSQKNTKILLVLMIVFFMVSVICYAEESNDKSHQVISAKKSNETASIIETNIRFYKIRADISGDFSLTDFIWNSTDEKEIKAQSKAASLFTKGKFKIGDNEAVITEHEWKLPKENVEIVSNPILISKLYSNKFESASISSKSKAIPYFVHEKDDLYRLKSTDNGIGFSFYLNFKEDTEKQRIIFDPLTIQIRTLLDRKPLADDISLPVGEPIIQETTHSLTILLKPDWYYGVLFSIPGEGNILLQLKFTVRDDN